MGEKNISIWFFIGSLLTIYGIIITCVSIYDLFYPLTDGHIVLGSLHAGVWWGVLLLIIGLFYVLTFRPGKSKR